MYFAGGTSLKIACPVPSVTTVASAVEVPMFQASGATPVSGASVTLTPSTGVPWPLTRTVTDWFADADDASVARQRTWKRDRRIMGPVMLEPSTGPGQGRPVNSGRSAGGRPATVDRGPTRTTP